MTNLTVAAPAVPPLPRFVTLRGHVLAITSELALRVGDDLADAESADGRLEFDDHEREDMRARKANIEAIQVDVSNALQLLPLYRSLHDKLTEAVEDGSLKQALSAERYTEVVDLLEQLVGAGA